jgi:hypothetical protein
LSVSLACFGVFGPTDAAVKYLLNPTLVYTIVTLNS